MKKKPKEHGPRPKCFVCDSGIASDRGWTSCDWCGVLHHSKCWDRFGSCRICGDKDRSSSNSHRVFERGFAVYNHLKNPERDPYPGTESSAIPQDEQSSAKQKTKTQALAAV